MGCWGITAFESDAGLDSVDYIRRSLPKNGSLELGSIIGALQRNDVRLPDAQDAESHTSPMALAEIVVKFMDHDIGDLDYDGKWAAKDKKFADITSFSASKESVKWLREYLSETLECAKENAGLQAEQGRKWNGWFEEKDWIGWQGHMAVLIGRLDGLLASPDDHIQLIPAQQPENGQIMKL